MSQRLWRFVLVLILAVFHDSCMAAANDPWGKKVSITAPELCLAPYVWKPVHTENADFIEATMPGAYVRMRFRGSASAQLLIDGSANADCPDSSMPVIEFSVDKKPFKIVQLSDKSKCYPLLLASDLDPKKTHTAEVVFRAADLVQQRWTSSKAHLRLIGFSLDDSAEVLTAQQKARRAIGFGDSITEGVGVDALFTSWQALQSNDALQTWLPEVSSALDAEYGQLGTGGQGMVQKVDLPPLTGSWDKYDAASSRLVEGKLMPAPDYVFCMMGTNDRNLDPKGGLGPLFQKNMPDIAHSYTNWLIAMRKAAPAAKIFCIIPPLGFHAEEIKAAVQTRRDEKDMRVILIDTNSLKETYGSGPSYAAYDGVHPNQYGQALLSALIVSEARAADN